MRFFDRLLCQDRRTAAQALNEFIEFEGNYAWYKWNEWRKARPDTLIDLQDWKPTTANLEMFDFSEANFTNANFTGVILADANLADAILTNACFVGADLSRAAAENAVFKNTDLTNAILDRTDLHGVSLKTARGLTASQISKALFVNTQLEPGLLVELLTLLHKQCS